MDYMSLEQFEKTDEYKTFIEENPSTGVLKVQVFTADQAIPIANAEVFITKKIGYNDVLFFSGQTDSSGIVDNIILPAPKAEINLDTFEVPKYTTYNLVVSSDEYKKIKQYNISMYGDVKVLQYVKIYSGGNMDGS